MRIIRKRLLRLEERHGLLPESSRTRYLRDRLEAARLRCGVRLRSQAPSAELSGMGIVAILEAGRRRASVNEGKMN